MRGMVGDVNKGEKSGTGKEKRRQSTVIGYPNL